MVQVHAISVVSLSRLLLCATAILRLFTSFKKYFDCGVRRFCLTITTSITAWEIWIESVDAKSERRSGTCCELCTSRQGHRERRHVTYPRTRIDMWKPNSTRNFECEITRDAKEDVCVVVQLHYSTFGFININISSIMLSSSSLSYTPLVSSIPSIAQKWYVV